MAAVRNNRPASLIINSPYIKPERYWEQDENGKLLTIKAGCRPAAYELVDTRTDTRRIETLELVNRLQAGDLLFWRRRALAAHLQQDGHRHGQDPADGSIITWQTLNAISYPKDARFSRAVFVVAPGLTVKSRLQVLRPGDEKNVYDEFRLCPNEAMRQKLNQVELLIENWHTLMPLKEQDRSVVKKGNESVTAPGKKWWPTFVRRNRM